MEGYAKTLVATEQNSIADAINEVIGITKRIKSVEGVSHGLKDEGDEIARALLVYGGHLLSEFGVEDKVSESIEEFASIEDVLEKKPERVYEIDESQIEKFFDNSGYIVREVRKISQIDGVFAAKITHKKSGIHCKANWNLTSFGIETYSDDVTYDAKKSSLYFGHWSITVFLCDGAKAYGNLMDFVAKIDRDVSVLDYFKKTDSGKKD